MLAGAVRPLQPGPEPPFELVADSYKGGTLGCRISLCGRRIGERPVVPRGFSRENGTVARRAVTDRDDVVEPSLQKLLQMFGALSTDVDATLGHDFESQRVNLGRCATGAGDFEPFSTQMARQTFGHL